MTREEAGRAYLTALAGLKIAASREQDAVQEGKHLTGTFAQAMVRVIDAREAYEKATR